MARRDIADAAVAAIKSLGVAVALDDFGTGYSSLSHLQGLAVQRLKIDRAFVKDLPSNTDSATIASAVISLAHSLGIEVTAEGIETVEQLEYLRERGCEEAQGFLLAARCRPRHWTHSSLSGRGPRTRPSSAAGRARRRQTAAVLIRACRPAARQAGSRARRRVRGHLHRIVAQGRRMDEAACGTCPGGLTSPLGGGATARSSIVRQRPSTVALSAWSARRCRRDAAGRQRACSGSAAGPQRVRGEPARRRRGLVAPSAGHHADTYRVSHPFSRRH